MFTANIAMYYFFNELYKTVKNSIENFYLYLNQKITIVNLFIFYSKIKSNYYLFQENNLYFKNVLYFINNILQKIYGKIMNIRVEPLSENWINTSIISYYEKKTILKNNISYLLNFGYNYNENYYINKDWTEDKYISSFQTTCINKSNKFNMITYENKKNENISNEDLECLMILKLKDKFIVRIKKHINEFYFTDILSKTHFLSIQYTHPKMNKPINIDLDKKFFIVGNELLSSSFVLRCLEYQKGINNNSFFFKKIGIKEFYYFDMNYKLSIMDNSINMFEINSDEYILVEKEKCVIKKNIRKII